jgi:thiamine transport system permease protein
VTRPLEAGAAGGGRWWALAALPLAFTAVFYLWPLVTILGMGLAPGGVPDLSPFLDVLGSARLRGVAWFTLWQAVVSTALTFVVATPLTVLLARYRFRGRSVVEAAVAVPFVLPTTVVATAFLVLLGPGGPLGLDLVGTVPAILVAHVFFNVAVVVRVVGGLLAQLDPDLPRAAKVLGASPWRAWRTVTAPLVVPAVLSAAAIVFLFTFTSLGVVLILGGSRISTLEVEVLRLTRDLLDLRGAAALAVLQLVGVVAALVVSARVQERLAVRQPLVVGERARQPLRGAGAGGLVVLCATVGLLLWGLPIGALVRRAVTGPDGWTLAWFRALAAEPSTTTLPVRPLSAVGTTIQYGVFATVVAVVVGGLAAWVVARRGGRAGLGLDALLMLPLGTSAATLGFGFVVALDTPPLDLRSSPLLIPIAHALVAMPFVVRTLVPVLRSIDEDVRRAAAVLGASPLRVARTIDLPIVLRPLGVAAAFAFAVSAGEFGATVFIARADVTTVPVAIFRLLSRPGAQSIGTAAALSLVLLVIVGVVVVLGERLRGDEGSGI